MRRAYSRTEDEIKNESSKINCSAAASSERMRTEMFVISGTVAKSNEFDFVCARMIENPIRVIRVRVRVCMWARAPEITLAVPN